MTTIIITTNVFTKANVIFNLSRNIDVHQNEASKTNEKATAGVTSGLININETVTWRGKHFGFYLKHKSRITAMNFYDYFVDEMDEGHFKSFKHEHFFEEQNGITIMTDKLCYETPFWIFGQIFDYLFLKKHLTTFLLERNRVLKAIAEG